jgi:hypothetical protein
VLTYPFLSGLAWLFFFAPQALGLLVTPDILPATAWSDSAVELTLALAAGAAICGVLGCEVAPRTARRSTPRAPAFFASRLAWVLGLIYSGFGLAGFLALARLAGGPLEFFSVDGAYALEWRGDSVMYEFISQLSYPGLACMLLAALHKPSAARWSAVALVSAVPVAHVALLGRRGHAASLALTLVVCVYFVRGYTVRRRWVLAAAALGAVFVLVAPAYRGSLSLGADRGNLRMPIHEALASAIGREGSHEVRNAVLRVGALRSAGYMGLGSAFLARAVQDILPRSVIGSDTKDAMIGSITRVSIDDLSFARYGFEKPFYEYQTAVAEAYGEFGVAGLALFSVTGALFALAWRSACRGGVFSQVVYVGLAPLALQGMTWTLSTILTRWLHLCLFLWPLLFFGGHRSAAGKTRSGTVRGRARRTTCESSM